MPGGYGTSKLAKTNAVWIFNTSTTKYYPYSFLKSTKTKNFDTFSIISSTFPMVLRYANHFLILSDDMITTYKWNQIVRVFGFKDFYKNFEKYALGQGFLGLTNGIKAKELLQLAPNCTYLLRFSRQMPEFLTVSKKYVNYCQRFDVK